MCHSNNTEMASNIMGRNLNRSERLGTSEASDDSDGGEPLKRKRNKNPVVLGRGRVGPKSMGPRGQR